MQHLDEGTIHAWLDGALTSEDAAHAEVHVGSCSACADAVAEARGFIAASSRILTALDAVPGGVAPGARGTRGSGARGRFVASWLVRERIAAVVALVVAGGALALVMARDTPQASRIDLASEPVRTFELAVADSPARPPVVAEEARNEGPPLRGAGARVAPSPAPVGDVAAARPMDSTPLPSLVQQAPRFMTDAAAASPERTDDSLRSLAVAQGYHNAPEAPAKAEPSLSEKLADGLARRRGAEASARFAEPVAPSIGRAGGASTARGGARLVQEEKMLEGGREVRRRIYRVDDLLVTLDERVPNVADEAMRVRSANTPTPDSTAGSTAIHWTNASGTEFTLSGAAPQARLERIRRLLGY